MGSMTDFWGPPISVYTREQAIEDGVLVEVPANIASEAGYRIPIVLTIGVHGILAAPSRYGEDYTGRLWDVLNMARIYSRPARQRGDASPVAFPVTFDGKTHRMVLAFSGYDGFMVRLPGED